MSLQPCPECKAEISSYARFCPRCGYPFERKSEPPPPRQTELVPHANRPVGIFLGISLCVIGAILLFSRFMIMPPFYPRHGMGPLMWQSHWHFFFPWRFGGLAPVWQIIGLVLLVLGLVQLLFGSTRRKSQIIE
ncbi:MAG: zinc ribbon domain-containing protein [Candidatus Omnitrophica bacterium]|nr:zinc ribbon domain-containing protein [Candidatus Omnitrophota bacterium]